MLAPLHQNKNPNLIFFKHKGAGREPLHWNQTACIKGTHPKIEKGNIRNCVADPVGGRIVRKEF